MTERTRIRRAPERAVTDRDTLYAVLDAGRVGHLAVTDDEGQPYILPVGYARRGDEVVVHGSTGSRLFRSLADGQSTCFTVTLLDGVVLARSTFESSMNYRSVMVLGVARRLGGDDELDALRAITEQLLPGRWAEARHPSPKERAATMVLALSLDECSVKVRTGPPADDPADLDSPTYSRIWGGVVPIAATYGAPIPDEHCPPDVAVPDYVVRWPREARG